MGRLIYTNVKNYFGTYFQLDKNSLKIFVGVTDSEQDLNFIMGDVVETYQLDNFFLTWAHTATKKWAGRGVFLSQIVWSFAVAFVKV